MKTRLARLSTLASHSYGGCVKNDALSTVEFSGLQVRALKSTCEPMLPHQPQVMLQLQHVKLGLDYGHGLLIGFDALLHPGVLRLDIASNL